VFNWLKETFMAGKKKKGRKRVWYRGCRKSGDHYVGCRKVKARKKSKRKK